MSSARPVTPASKKSPLDWLLGLAADVRAGDMLSALATFVVVQWLALSVQAYAGLNIAITSCG